VSATIEFIHEYLGQEKITQSAYSEACGMAASNLSSILSYDIMVGHENIHKLLRGLNSREARLRMVAAYLRDSVPKEFSNNVVVQVGDQSDLMQGLVSESGPADTAAAAALAAFHELPSPKLKDLTVNFLRSLRDDAELRDLFTRMMSYLGKEEPAVSKDAAAKKPTKKSDKY
jgi:hypothetical protein